MFDRTRNFLRGLRRSTKGVTAVEFGFVAPVLILSIMGILDLGYRSYSVAVLQGAVQKAARDSGLETGANTNAIIDAKVTKVVKQLAHDANVTFKRSSYGSFTDVNTPEDYTDTNNDGSCNFNEPFEDVNGNGTWDQDRGQDGQGGARDAVLYEVKATYPRVFPMAGLLGLPANETITARTVLRNQPYQEQEKNPPVAGNCP